MLVLRYHEPSTADERMPLVDSTRALEGLHAHCSSYPSRGTVRENSAYDIPGVAWICPPNKWLRFSRLDEFVFIRCVGEHGKQCSRAFFPSGVDIQMRWFKIDDSKSKSSICFLGQMWQRIYIPTTNGFVSAEVAHVLDKSTFSVHHEQSS